jgi:hypothetical protein
MCLKGHTVWRRFYQFHIMFGYTNPGVSKTEVSWIKKFLLLGSLGQQSVACHAGLMKVWQLLQQHSVSQC